MWVPASCPTGTARRMAAPSRVSSSLLADESRQKYTMLLSLRLKSFVSFNYYNHEEESDRGQQEVRERLQKSWVARERLEKSYR